MIKPHHISIVDTPFIYNDQKWMIPELLSEIEDEKLLNLFSNYLLNCSGQPVKYGYQFIVKNIYFYNALSSTNKISYLVAAEENYFKDVPIFFEEQWDVNFSLNEMVCLGWTVNKYTEPAILFGIYPILKFQDKFIIDQHSMINKWGLISDSKTAKNLAKLNSENDPDSENWTSLAIYVDKFTLKKLQSL